MSNQPADQTFVNGKPVTNPHVLFESGSKLLLIEASTWKGTDSITINTLWSPKDAPSTLCRTKNPTKVLIDDIPEFIVDLQAVYDKHTGMGPSND